MNVPEYNCDFYSTPKGICINGECEEIINRFITMIGSNWLPAMTANIAPSSFSFISEYVFYQPSTGD